MTFKSPEVITSSSKPGLHLYSTLNVLRQSFLTLMLILSVKCHEQKRTGQLHRVTTVSYTRRTVENGAWVIERWAVPFHVINDTVPQTARSAPELEDSVTTYSHAFT